MGEPAVINTGDEKGAMAVMEPIQHALQALHLCELLCGLSFELLCWPLGCVSASAWWWFDASCVPLSFA